MTATTGGVHFIPFGTTGGTAVMTSPSVTRWVAIFGGQLYADGGAANNLFRVGTGTPMSGPQSAMTLPGLPTGGSESPYGFVLFDRNASVPGVDTLYLADDRTVAGGGGIQKWTYNGTTWTLVTTFNADATTHFRGVAGRVLAGGAVELYVTTTEASANRLMEMVDDGTSPSTIFITMATAPANTLYRGVAFSPM
jgi:hypothetical protein